MMLKTNEELQRDVQNAIKWEPLLNAAEIGVTAKDGVVTLTGVVDSYAKKVEAETAAKGVAGVKAVAEDITINFGGLSRKNDTEIAEEVLNALKWNWEIPNEQITVEVEKGWVTLSGHVQWNFQREAARKAVTNLNGVIGVQSKISLESDSQDAVEKKNIEQAFGRNWSMDDNEINVEVAGNKVTLSGMVTSLYQKDEAERIAWNAPGVCAMDNQLVVGYLN